MIVYMMTTDTAAPMFTVTANVALAGSNVGTIYSILCTARVATPEDARAFAASMPKSYRVKGGTLSGVPSPKGGYMTVGYISCQAWFGDVNVQGDANEAGIARLRKFLARVPHTFERGPAANAAAPDAIRAFLGA